MAQQSWPFENIDTSESQFSLWADALAAQSGVQQVGNQLAVTAGTGMTVNVASGRAIIRGHYYNNTATEVVAIDAASASARIDIVVLELDPSANTILLKVVKGTPAASPVAPTLTQTESGVYQFPLARVAVASSTTTITAGILTDVRQMHTGFEGSPIKEITATSYTITSADVHSTLYINTSSATTISVPMVLMPGQRIDIVKWGTGDVTISGSGQSLKSADSNAKITKQYGVATVQCFANSGTGYLLAGNLAS